MKILIIALVVAVVALAWKLLNRRWSRQVYIQRDYEKFQHLDEQVTGEAVDVEPLVTSESGERVVN